MTQQPTLALLLLCIAHSIGGAQSSMPKTQIGETWIDATTGLMWAAKDNGKAITWHRAFSYCRNSQLAGYSDWRLATVNELAGLVEKSDAPKQDGNAPIVTISLGRHVRGDLLLRGDPWSSSNRNIDRFGHPYGDGNFFDFVQAKPSADLPYFLNKKYALCVRRP